jgi:hypothetical protein
MSTKRNYMWGWIILAGVLAGAAAQADPIQLQAYTGAVGGSNECPGGGPPVVTHFLFHIGYLRARRRGKRHQRLRTHGERQQHH